MERSAEVRDAYRDAAEAFVAVVDGVAPDQWDRPALGEWNVRELVGHASRALSTVEDYLATPAERADLGSAAAYFAAALADPSVHAAVADRARERAGRLGPDVRTEVTLLARRVLDAVGRTPDGALLATPAGGIRLLDYLATRVVELVTHTLDLTDALGEPPVLPPSSATVALRTLAEVAAARSGTVDDAALVRALTGRAPWPGDLNVLR
jgi:uncharacterized protein (TIGR03083 family)